MKLVTPENHIQYIYHHIKVLKYILFTTFVFVTNTTYSRYFVLRPSVIVDNCLFAIDGMIIHILFSINEIEKIDISKPIK